MVRAALIWVLAWLAACSSPSVATEGSSATGEDASLSLSESDRTRLAELTRELSANRTLSAEALRAKRARSHGTQLGYDAETAAGLTAIQGSTLALDAAELQRLGELGFVVSSSKAFPTMLYAYAALYVEDLPLFVSADSVLDAVYRSYDAMLKDIELSVLISDLSELISSMRAQLPGLSAEPDVQRDLDCYLAVTRGLLDGAAASPVAGADPSEIAQLTQLAQHATGHQKVHTQAGP